eukprot:CAMPEP_0167774140 /NCGR_PEP_ID=MMETSP0111_2-20121227/1828_1 /TAXON_ID=91324 /ORGANISM="Lotharella globosa, Strain CCCM811" /LENGTH=237 /DNA_ID=CAMNT_0007663891 /DNA_START=1589 /DNA_END=2302 /DNA_ORIENTATION=+
MATEGHDVTLVYNHMPKTGGSTIKMMLAKVVRNFRKRNENYQFEEEDFAPNTFRVTSIRSPCQYYRSLWTFGSRGGGSFHKQMVHRGYEEYYGSKAPYDSARDLAKFEKWLQVVGSVYQDRLQRKLLNKALGNQTIASSSARNIDCWVRTENMREDLQTCLKMFESRGGLVDWEAFEIYKDAHKNPSDHAKCHLYFNKARKNLVEEFNKEIFENFQFDDCCSGAGMKGNTVVRQRKH